MSETSKRCIAEGVLALTEGVDSLLEAMAFFEEAGDKHTAAEIGDISKRVGQLALNRHALRTETSR